jgi:ATP-dependent Clp protease ATP-binding subunit ClpA
MDLNRFTEMAQEALLQAQSLAGEHSHGQIEGEHLLLALLRQSDGVVPMIVQGLDLQASMLAQPRLVCRANYNRRWTRPSRSPEACATTLSRPST